MRLIFKNLRLGWLLVALGGFAESWALEIPPAPIEGKSSALENTFPLENRALNAQAEPRPEMTDVVVGSGSGGTHQVDQVTVESVAAGPRTPATAEERNQLDAAIAQVEKSDFAGASENLVAILKSNPHSAIADEAWYWLGEVRYLDRAFAEALTISNTLIQYFPQSDYVSAARLRIGLIYYEMKEYAAARDMINTLMADSPNETIAGGAETLGEKLKAAGF